ncbi:MAG: class I SAM-dependent methyltransferase, partial [Actinobacteria bacterium]|nr:class I SAM-dependent methyltransferase [Actinomycetota bacterium]
MALHPTPTTSSVAGTLEPVVRRLLGGQLPIALRAWDGSSVGPPDPPVTVVVHSPRALQHLLWAPGELGLARAHVSGHLDIEGDVFALLAVRDLLASADHHVRVGFDGAGWLAILRAARSLGVIGARPPLPAEEAHLRGTTHTLRRDARAISHHYDVGNDFYRLLLGPSLTYSCAYWIDDQVDLTEAQAAKHELICRKLDVHPGTRLLDVGCGWGSLALHAAKHHGASVVGITISNEQAALARERVRDAGLEQRVEIRVQDYRQVADGPFDAISSVGMFEHVGAERMGVYFSHLYELLDEGGRFLNHAISRPAGQPPGIDADSFVGRYVFPDGELLEVGRAVSAMAGAGFEVRHVEDLREHYVRTLR